MWCSGFPSGSATALKENLLLFSDAHQHLFTAGVRRPVGQVEHNCKLLPIESHASELLIHLKGGHLYNPCGSAVVGSDSSADQFIFPDVAVGSNDARRETRAGGVDDTAGHGLVMSGVRHLLQRLRYY